MNNKQQNKKTKFQSFLSEWLGCGGVILGLIIISYILAQMRSCSDKIQSARDKKTTTERVDSAFIQRNGVINAYKQQCK